MIPDYQTLMLPVLKACADGEVSTSEVIDKLAIEFDLSQEDQEQLLPSGKQTTFSNRIHWAKGYLKQAGLVTYPSRGDFIITNQGKEVLESNPQRIDNNYLTQFKEFREFKNRKGTRSADTEISNEVVLSETESTPDELLRASHKAINNSLANELLARVRDMDPFFFEQLIVKLLLAMGYGGTTEGSGKILGKSGDDGVDGVIDQDPLGVDQIYVQAKRYGEGNNIGAAAIRDFFGALNLKKAQKGIFFTTSAFSQPAIDTVRNLGMRIVMIDGTKLAKLMIQYNIGARDEEIIHLKKIDEDFFDLES